VQQNLGVDSKIYDDDNSKTTLGFSSQWQISTSSNMM
jgi:hypothetical protein